MNRLAVPIAGLVVVAATAAADTPPVFAPPTPPPAPTPPAEPTPPPTPTPPPEPTPAPETENRAERTTAPIAPVAKPAPVVVEKPASDKPVITSEEDAPPKLSLATEADRIARQRPGFRLALGLTYGYLWGLRGAPGGRLLGPKLRMGLRLDRDWSLLASFEYASASGRGNGLATGLRFAGTLDPTWHVTPSLSLSAGFGFGGIVEGGARTEHVGEGLGVDQIETSYTFPDASTPIASCTGAGVATLLRGQYAFVLGPRAALALSAEAVGQWTLCTDDSGRFEPDTGAAIERHQYWPHIGATFTAEIMWR